MSNFTTLLQGDSPTFQFSILSSSSNHCVIACATDCSQQGDPFNLADYNIDFFIKRSLQDDDDAAEFHGQLNSGIQLAATVVDGIINVTLPVSVTQNLRLGRPYFWYLVLTHSIIVGKVFIPARGLFLATLPNTY